MSNEQLEPWAMDEVDPGELAGRSEQHTLEPWIFVEHDHAFYIVRRWDESITPENSNTFGSAYGAHIARIEYSPEVRRTRTQALANARRIVACVNACAGLNTKRLETKIEECKRLLEKGIFLAEANQDLALSVKTLIDAHQRGSAGFPIGYEEWNARIEYAKNVLEQTTSDAEEKKI